VKFLLMAVPLILFAGFLVIWQGLRRAYRRRLDWEASVGAHEGLDDLLAMKAKLTEEEYRRLRQVVVKKMTESPEGEPAFKEVNLAALEQELRQQHADRTFRPSGESERKS